MIGLLALSLSALGADYDPAAPITPADAKECSGRSEAEQQAFTEELEAMYGVMNSDPKVAAKNGKAVLKLEKKGHLCTDDDRFWGAMVLLQVTDEEAAARAYGLAKSLVESRYPRGAWIAAQAYDRWAIAFGNLQSYGTQTRYEDGKTCLYWVDPQFTDDKRAAYGQPALQEVIAKVLETNGRAGDEPTVQRLQHLDLWCKPMPWSGKRNDLQDPYAR